MKRSEIKPGDYAKIIKLSSKCLYSDNKDFRGKIVKVKSILRKYKNGYFDGRFELQEKVWPHWKPGDILKPTGGIKLKKMGIIWRIKEWLNAKLK